jgi:hypothetical protein
MAVTSPKQDEPTARRVTLETPASLGNVGDWNEPRDASAAGDPDRDQTIAELLEFSFEAVEQTEEDTDLEAGCLSCS